MKQAVRPPEGTADHLPYAPAGASRTGDEGSNSHEAKPGGPRARCRSRKNLSALRFNKPLKDYLSKHGHRTYHMMLGGDDEVEMPGSGSAHEYAHSSRSVTCYGGEGYFSAVRSVQPVVGRVLAAADRDRARQRRQQADRRSGLAAVSRPFRRLGASLLRLFSGGGRAGKTSVWHHSLTCCRPQTNPDPGHQTRRGASSSRRGAVGDVCGHESLGA